MLLKTILNRLEKQPGFVYGDPVFVAPNKVKPKRQAKGPANDPTQGERERPVIHIPLRAREGSRPYCSGCGKKRPGYDTLAQRTYDFVPLWGLLVFFVYAPRRVACKTCGGKVEMLPWATGKSPVTISYAWYLASWAKMLSWTEVGRRFRTSWDTVFSCVAMAVAWGRAHVNVDGVRSIGVDEIAWRKGPKYLTMVYQIDHGCTRLLWIGRDRTKKIFEDFFTWMGKERSELLQFVASDLWRGFQGVVVRFAPHALHILDRFHIAKKFSEAVDAVRRGEMKELRKKGRQAELTKTRWILLKRQHRLKPSQKGRLAELLRTNLRTVRAYLLKEEFHAFWGYVSPYGAGKFLDRWCTMVMRSKLEPMKKVVGTLRSHRGLILNWFRARGAFSHGATEGMNNKARVTTKRAYGFRTVEHAEVALYHTLGKLPEPPCAHRFV